MSWDEFDKEIRALAAKIDWAPEVIAGVVRGGLVPARMLSSLLKVPQMRCISLVRNGGTREVLDELRGDVTGKRVLVVEDMIETGKSLEAAKAYLESKGAVVKTACLYTMPISEVAPDYSLREVGEVFHFPWE
jgi:hypoxanthine phosphoribosyltransferase